MKRVIVTGATGTIGLALVNYLLNNGIEVIAIVNPDSKRISRLPSHERLKVLAHSITQLETIQTDDLLECDACFHLAWQGASGVNRNNTYMQNLNIRNTLDTVKFAEKAGCKVFLGAGSQAEYGRVDGKLKSSTPTNPENGYGIAKLCAGQLSRILCEQMNMKHVWTRILSIYGPNDGEGTMIISSIRKMLRGEQPLFSKGEQMWDYLYCEDAARALYLAAEKGIHGKVYSIGSGVAHPLKEYILQMQKSISNDVKVGIGRLPYAEKQVMYLCADIDELTRDTGFMPFVTFEQGIQETIKWCKDTQDEVK